MLRIEPLTYRRYAHPYYTRASGWAAYAHQAALMDLWDTARVLMVSTKTGSGKTAAAVLPAVKNRENALFLYPTNALLDDQAASIRQVVEQFPRRGSGGGRLQVYELDMLTGEWDNDRISQADVIIVRVQAKSLGDLTRALSLGYKGRAIERILDLDRPLLFLTNPDTLFLILTLRYREGGSLLLGLRQFNTLVVDEFHLYHDAVLARLLFMVELAHELLSFQRTVFLSATPDGEVLSLLRSLYPDMTLLSPESAAAYASRYKVADKRPVMHGVDLRLSPGRRGSAELIAELITADSERIRAARRETTSERFVAGLAIVNSVQEAIVLEDQLVRAGSFTREELGVYRGLMHRGARQIDGKTLVIGTSAVEVGVDFDCRYLYFEAWDFGSFMQRMGRLGRRRAGDALFIGAYNEVAGFRELDGKALARDVFEARARQLFDRSGPRAEFVRSRRGLQVARLMLEELLRGATTSNTAVEALRGIFRDYAARLVGNEREGHFVDRFVALNRLPWAPAYMDGQTFRGGLPSVQVWDAIEAKRRGDTRFGVYNVDFYTLLSRARLHDIRPARNGQPPQVVIAGYQAWEQPGITFVPRHPVSDGRAELHVLPDDFQLKRGPAFVPPELTELFGSAHVYTLVPDSFAGKLDWRLRGFKHETGTVFLDSDALVVAALLEAERS